MAHGQRSDHIAITVADLIVILDADRFPNLDREILTASATGSSTQIMLTAPPARSASE